MHKSLHGLALATALSFAATTPAVAEDVTQASLNPVIEEENAQERINYSGKLRMLSQRIPSAACNYVQGIDKESSGALLASATAEFDQILAALEHGDPGLNIQATEKRRKTLSKISELRTKWEPFKAAAEAVTNGEATEEDVAFILRENGSVLGTAKELVSELVKQYSNPNAVPFADLMLVDISGRQRMLTQKMSKESCMMTSNLGDAQTLEALVGTMTVFENSLDALRHGMPAVGIKSPPNKTISKGLDEVLAEWTEVKPFLETVMAGEDIDDAERADKFNRLNVTMAKMNQVVGMYAEATKR